VRQLTDLNDISVSLGTTYMVRMQQNKFAWIETPVTAIIMYGLLHRGRGVEERGE